MYAIDTTKKSLSMQAHRTMKTKFKVFVFLLTAFLFQTVAAFQGNEGTNIADDPNVITLLPPSKNFMPIYLQQHLNLPRLGVLNDYRIKTSSAPVSNNPRIKSTSQYAKQSPATREKLKQLRSGYINYAEMVRMKYMSSIYDDLNKTTFVKATATQDRKDQNALIAQSHLQLVTKKLGVRGLYDSAYGGANQFEKRRNYTAFIQENLAVLRNWSSSFLEKDELTAYHIATLRIGKYDFENEGYWMRIAPSLPQSTPYGNSLQLFKNLLPQSTYENKLLNHMTGPNGHLAPIQVLLKIAPSKAENFVNNGIQTLYVASKVKTAFKEVAEVRPNTSIPPLLTFSYSYMSPKIVIYEDAALTKQVGSISLEQLILRKN